MAIRNMQTFDDSNDEFVVLEKLIDWLRQDDCRLSDGRFVPLLIWGAAGTGKTQQIKNYCKKHNLELKTYQPAHEVSGKDILGETMVNTETNKTEYALPAWLPEADTETHGIIFIDEINRAPEEVLAGLMEPLGEGTISQSGWKLPKNWSIIAAANPLELGYMVQPIDEAMVDRLLHYAPGWDSSHWASWATKAGIDQRIINFALMDPDNVFSGEAVLPTEVTDKLKPTPRSYAYLSALYREGMPSGLLRVISDGILGVDHGEMFRDSLIEEMPLSYEEILAGSYDKKVHSWLSKLGPGQPGSSMINASLGIMTSALVDQDPVSSTPALSRNPENGGDVTAFLLGRFLARIPRNTREEAFVSIAKSAPQWENVLRKATIFWERQFRKKASEASKQKADSRRKQIGNPNAMPKRLPPA